MLFPILVSEFTVQAKDYRIAQGPEVHFRGPLRLYLKQVDEFGTTSWDRLVDAHIRPLFETMVFSPESWRARWNKQNTSYPVVGNAVFVADVLDPILLRTYVERHGAHGRGGQSFEIEVYRAVWACPVGPDSAPIRVWAKDPNGPTPAILLQAMARMTVSPNQALSNDTSPDTQAP